MSTVLFFFNNLRLDDNRALQKALSHGDPIIPVVVNDVDRQQKEWFGWSSMGSYRHQFWLESVKDLNESLKSLGVDLAWLTGTPLSALKEITASKHPARVIVPHVIGQYEAADLLALSEYCNNENIAFECVWDWTLIDHVDLSRLSNGFTGFRKRVEKSLKVAESITCPEDIPFCPHNLPSFKMNNFTSAAPLIAAGGETAAKQHLNDYIWESKAILHYKQTRNKLIGKHVSSKLSYYLANGCLSVRTIFHAIKQFESRIKKNESTYWLVFELLWRDFFQFQYLKHHNHWFSYGGLQQKDWQPPTLNSEACLEWANGQTSNDFINASMIELKKTGYMSNRGRQNAASYLIHDLGQDWRYGASVFEHYLMDYDMASNIGNWMYIAGIGNSSQLRVFNVNSQQERYDKSLTFTNHWL